MAIHFSGLKDRQQKLRFIRENAGKIRGKVKMSELFNPAFMRNHTRLSDVREFFDNSGFKVATKADMRAIPDDIWDKYTARVSHFSTWRDMLCTATVEYIQSRLARC